MENKWGEDLQEIERMKEPEEKQTASVWIVNIFYIFLVLFVSFVIAETVGTVFGWILKPDSIVRTKDLSRNFFLVYPLYGLLTLAVMLPLRYFFAKWFGLRQGFRKKAHTRESRHFLHFVAAYAVYEFLKLYFFWDVIPSWFLGGSIAAVLRLFNPYDVYDTLMEGQVELIYLTVYFWWIMAILEILFAVLSFRIVKKGRYAGEKDGIAEREKQLKELQDEHEKLAGP